MGQGYERFIVASHAGVADLAILVAPVGIIIVVVRKIIYFLCCSPGNTSLVYGIKGSQVEAVVTVYLLLDGEEE